MPIPGVSPCFLCNDPLHWQDNCWTRKPPASKGHHEARIATYRYWFTDGWRITAWQKRQLIEHENQMWQQVKRERKPA